MSWKRSSRVDCLEVSTLGYSAVLNVGDVKYVNSVRKLIYVKQLAECFDSSVVLPQKKYSCKFIPINENITTTFIQQNPCLKVGKIKVLSSAYNGVIHIGNSADVFLETRSTNFL